MRDAIRYLRSLEPPPARASLRDELLDAYHRDVSRPRFAASMRPLTALVIAALILLGVWLARPVIIAREHTETAFLKQRLARVRQQLDHLRSERAAFDEHVAASVLASAPPTQRLLAIAGDASLLRLACARALEGVDQAGAVQRYREIVDWFAHSPAVDVARDRLAVLTP